MSEKTEKSTRTYEKVVQYIKDEIWRGSLKCGERLPPERELAETLGVSRNSVREAIRTLSMMGYGARWKPSPHGLPPGASFPSRPPVCRSLQD